MTMNNNHNPLDLSSAFLMSNHEKKPMKAAREQVIGRIVKTGHEVAKGGKIIQVRLTARDVRLLDIVSLGALGDVDYGLKPGMRVAIGGMTGMAIDDEHIVFHQRDVVTMEATPEEAAEAGAPKPRSILE